MKKDSKDAIHFIMTGGTIDSFYDGIIDTFVPYKHSVIPTYVQSLQLHLNLKFTEICMKDSRNIVKADLTKMLNAVKKSLCSKVIITHGIYTMAKTAKYLKKHLKRDNQTIILIGSLIPLIGFTPSDAPFNIGYSIAKVQDIKPGIHICKNGRLIPT